MRRSSNAVLQTQTSEPLIVVEDSCYSEDCGGYNTTASSGYPGGGGDDVIKRGDSESRHSSEDEDGSPTMNPYLLSPFAREIRKHSLPTPQCSGITASQVRRLSERGGDNSGPGPRQAEFLATLSTAPQVTAGGRRHSVVTISKVPSSLFGRNRRESVAAFPANQVGFPLRILPNRRESIACPPSTEPRGSVHNLQLDIMDDIVQARKVRMKLWTTSSEKLCEVQPLDDVNTGAASSSSTTSGAGVQRYSNSTATSSGGSSSRRYSDFVGTTLAPIPSSSATSKRRASELPPIPSSSSTTSAAQQSKTCNKKNSGASSSTTPSKCGIVCTNSDLVSILSLSASATEIHNQQQPSTPLKTQSEESCKNSATPTSPATAPNKILDQKRTRLKSNRSNSFDVSVLHKIDGTSQLTVGSSKENLAKAPSTWFARRHQPLTIKQPTSDDSNKKSQSSSSSSCFAAAVNVKKLPAVKQSQLQSCAAAAPEDVGKCQKTSVIIEKEPTKKKGRVVWDEKSGSLVDPQALGSAIEVFLRQTTPDPTSASSGDASANWSAPSAMIQPNSTSKSCTGGGGNNNNHNKSTRSNWFSSTSGGGSSNVKADEQQKQDGGGGGGGDSSATEAACDSSICSTLKDLFVK